MGKRGTRGKAQSMVLSPPAVAVRASKRLASASSSGNGQFRIKRPLRTRRQNRKTNQEKAPVGNTEAAEERTWAALPDALLARCFSLLHNAKDLTCAGLTCQAWNREVDGGYRKQLAASAAMRTGNCRIRTLPFSRKDGAVLEVLLLDGKEQRIVTLQQRQLHPKAYRLSGLTLKVWSESSLKKETPLLVVHDVLKHFQTVDGQLLCWKIADNEIIRVGCRDEGSSCQGADSSWAADARIRCYKINPQPPCITELGIRSNFGNGNMPHEWVDIPGGGLASVAFLGPTATNPNSSVRAVIYDADNGSRVMSATASVEDQPPVPHHLGEAEPCMLVARSAGYAAKESLVLVTACLFDQKVYRWEITKSWKQNHLAAHRRREQVSNAGDPSSFEAEDEGQEDLQLMFTCPGMEQVYDLAMSTPSSQVYVVSQENFYVFNGEGQPMCAISMADWPGVHAHPLLMMDVGAFSWPLPNTSRVAFHLEATNAIYIVDLAASPPKPWPAPFRPPPPHWRPSIASCRPDAAPQIGATPIADPEQEVWMPQPSWPAEWGNTSRRIYNVSAHLTFKPKPESQGSAPRTGQALMRLWAAVEPTVVEYTQCGRVLLTVGDTSLGGTQQALNLQSQDQRLAWDWGRQQVQVEPRKCPGRFQRCLAFINTETGMVFRTVPIRNGVVEAVHSAGSTVAVSVARKDYDFNTTEGAILLLDFGPELKGRK